MRPKVILDTNVFVGGGFKRTSASARILDAVKQGELRMIWNDATRREIEMIVHKIPPLRSFKPETLFRAADRFTGATHPEEFAFIADPDDRKFAALGKAAHAIIISSDEHLLAHRDTAGLKIMTPGEFWKQQAQAAQSSPSKPNTNHKRG